MEVEVTVHQESSSAPARTERLKVHGAISIGRSAQSTLCLEGESVSRTHVVIDVLSDGLRVEDQSSNGTVAGDVVLRRQVAEVPFGTPLMIGQFTVSVAPAGKVPVLRRVATPSAQPDPRARMHDVAAALPPPLLPNRNAPVRRDVGRPLPLEPAALPPPTPTPQGSLLPLPRPTAPATPESAPAADAVVAGAAKPGVHVGARESNAEQGELLDSKAAAPPEGSAPAQANATQATSVDIELRREIHKKLLENLDLAKIDATKLDDPSMRPRVLTALQRIVRQMDTRIPSGTDRDTLVGELADEALGLGPLERFLADAAVSEIMVVDPSTIYVEQSGKLVKAAARFTDDERVRAVIERIVTPLGRRIDESSPLVDARLKDGSRVNAVIKPLALRGSCITIRKFSKVPLTMEKLIGFGALTSQMARFISRSVIAKKNIIISGGTGSGKTTLLNVLSGSIPSNERIVTIEDAAELQLAQPHVVSLETRPANMEGRGEYTIRDLVKNALRMRPDRIVVGECRGGEALDMLQAMNTGHDGSLTTTHANSPEEAVTRIETLVLTGGVELPSRAIREQIASSIHLVVQQTRFSDGSRRVAEVAEVTGIEDDGKVALRPIFKFIRTGTGHDGKVLGEHRATGYLPSYLDAFITAGLVRKGEPYL